MTTDPDFIKALALVYADLGIWREGQKCRPAENDPRYTVYCFACEHGQFREHDIPCPPLDDHLLAVILRRLREEKLAYQITDDEGITVFSIGHGWWHEGGIKNVLGSAESATPVEAAVLSYAEVLQAKESNRGK